MNEICPNCLDDTNFDSISTTPDGRQFKLYLCPTCHRGTRVYDVPLTCRETVLVALVEDALSASRELRIPSREEEVEQLLMFPRVRVWD